MKRTSAEPARNPRNCPGSTPAGGWSRPVGRALAAAVLVVLGLAPGAPVQATHESLVIDDHPTGGPGATGEHIIVPSYGQPGSPLFEGPEAPNTPHLHGPWIGSISPGHPDPHSLDASHFLGHGIAQPIVHAPPPGSGGGSPPSGDGPAAAPRDVNLREIVIPIGPDGRAIGEGAELAALFGQAGWFETLFVERTPVPEAGAAAQAESTSTAAATPDEKAAEADARYAELLALNAEFATRSAQYRAGRAEFEARLKTADELIARANADGLPEVAEQLQEDRDAIAEHFENWNSFMLDRSADAARELDAAYARNARDGVGPTSSTELADEMGRRGDFIVFTGDQARVEATRQSAAEHAAGAAGATRHASIFADPTQGDAWRDFAFDYSDTFYEYLHDPQLFAERYASYAKGAGLAVKDGLVDLAELGVELVDTNLELQQQTLNQLFGTNIDIVGSENLEFLANAAAAAAQFDSDAFYTTFDSFASRFERRFEQMAGSGEKGLREALEGTGYVFTTVIGGEEIAFRAVALGAKGVKITRLGHADEVLAAGDEVADAARGATPSTAPGQAPVATLDGATGGSLSTAADGTRTLRTPDGTELAFGERLGGGATSEAFAVPGRDDVVIKVTRLNADNLAGAAFDSAGYRILDEVDPSLAPRQIGDPVIVDGKQYAVFERADSFQDWRVRQAQAQGMEIPSRKNSAGETVPDLDAIPIDMTPGQAAAYKDGIGKLNDRGYVFLDNKIDNWALVKTGEADTWTLKIIDPGSIVKLTDPAAARRLQAKIDLGDDSLAGIYRTGNRRLVIAGVRDEIMNEFDEFLDVEAMRELGIPITSLSEVPFNPVHGFQNPSVRQIFDADIAAMSDAEFVDHLRMLGWSDSQIEEFVDLPPGSRGQGLRTAMDSRSGDGVPPAGARDMSNAEFADYLRSQDPAYWTDERIRAYMETPPPPNPWGESMADIFGDDVATEAPPAPLPDAVNAADAAHAAPPARPLGLLQEADRAASYALLAR